MARVFTNDAAESQSVRDLVDTVERLGSEDQDRILRIVTLLALAPARVQKATQQMLRELLESNPATARDCIEQVDEVIDYLEDNIDAADALPTEAIAEAPLRWRYN